MITNEQIEEMKKLRDSGEKYEAIGNKFGVSRQRVHQLLTGYISPSNKPIIGGLDWIREEVRIRDNYTCQLCMKQWIPGERRFDVHHLDERMESIRDYHYDRSNQDKLITLCHRCHLRLAFIIKRTFDVLGITLESFEKSQEKLPH